MYIPSDIVCKKAIECGELLLWLKGEGGYAFPPTHNSDVNDPNYAARVTAFHHAYRDAPNEDWLEQYKDSILLMLRGSAEEIYIALAWLAQQFRLEYKNRAVFSLEPDFLCRVKETLVKRKNLIGDNHWNEIEAYNAALSRRYGRAFL